MFVTEISNQLITFATEPHLVFRFYPNGYKNQVINKIIIIDRSLLFDMQFILPHNNCFELTIIFINFPKEDYLCAEVKKLK
jgi:hypothetical protein